jgi:hypothetical protein
MKFQTGRGSIDVSSTREKKKLEAAMQMLTAEASSGRLTEKRFWRLYVRTMGKFVPAKLIKRIIRRELARKE